MNEKLKEAIGPFLAGLALGLVLMFTISRFELREEREHWLGVLGQHGIGVPPQTPPAGTSGPPVQGRTSEPDARR